MNPALVALTRVALGALLLGSVLVQVLLPAMAHELGGDYVETTRLVLPYSTAGILTVLAVQVAIVSVWWLLEATVHGRLFAPRSLHGATIVTIACAAATLIPCAVMIHLLFFVGVGGPGVLLMLFATLVIGSAITLLFIVLRGILAQAIAEHDELQAVI